MNTYIQTAAEVAKEFGEGIDTVGTTVEKTITDAEKLFKENWLIGWGLVAGLTVLLIVIGVYLIVSYKRNKKINKKQKPKFVR